MESKSISLCVSFKTHAIFFKIFSQFINQISTHIPLYFEYQIALCN
jgi:hypothetical protein